MILDYSSTLARAGRSEGCWPLDTVNLRGFRRIIAWPSVTFAVRLAAETQEFFATVKSASSRLEVKCSCFSESLEACLTRQTLLIFRCPVSLPPSLGNGLQFSGARAQFIAGFGTEARSPQEKIRKRLGRDTNSFPIENMERFGRSELYKPQP
jgi:hypothetical protein